MAGFEAAWAFFGGVFAVVVPVILGGGKPWLPDDVRIDLELIEERRFPSGAVYVAYAAR